MKGKRSGRNQVEAIEERLIDLDDGARKLFQPYTDSAPVRALDLLSNLATSRSLG